MELNKKDNIFISRKENHVVIIDMNTCQKLLIEDKITMSKTDAELKKMFMSFGVQAQQSKNNRV